MKSVVEKITYSLIWRNRFKAYNFFGDFIYTFIKTLKNIIKKFWECLPTYIIRNGLLKLAGCALGPPFPRKAFIWSFVCVEAGIAWLGMWVTALLRKQWKNTPSCLFPGAPKLKGVPYPSYLFRFGLRTPLYTLFPEVNHHPFWSPPPFSGLKNMSFFAKVRNINSAKLFRYIQAVCFFVLKSIA